MKEVTGLMVYNMLYKYKDTLCFYHDKESRIYEIHPTHTQIRYRIDKGEYGWLETQKEHLEATGKDVSYSRIDIEQCNETSHYVIGFYQFKRRFYIFIYDKKTGITKNYLRLHDDLMSLPVEKGVGRLDWTKGLKFKEEYLWNTYSGSKFMRYMEQLKSELGEEKWKIFCQTHPDFYRIYQMQSEKLNQQSGDYYPDRIIWRYHFK